MRGWLIVINLFIDKKIKSKKDRNRERGKERKCMQRKTREIESKKEGDRQRELKGEKSDYAYLSFKLKANYLLKPKKNIQVAL